MNSSASRGQANARGAGDADRGTGVVPSVVVLGVNAGVENGSVEAPTVPVSLKESPERGIPAPVVRGDRRGPVEKQSPFRGLDPREEPLAIAVDPCLGRGQKPWSARRVVGSLPGEAQSAVKSPV